MNILLVYASPNGTTQALCVAMQNALKAQGHAVTLYNLGEGEHRNVARTDPACLSHADIVGFGYPVYHLKEIQPMRQFLRRVLPGARRLNPSLRAFLLATYGGVTTGMGLTHGVQALRQSRVPFVGAAKVKAPHFSHTEGFPDAEALQTVETFCRRLTEAGFQPIQPAQTRALLGKRKPIIRAVYPFAKIAELLHRQPIRMLHEACVGCGACATACIALAIHVAEVAVRNPRRCLYCYRCASVCPRQAIRCERWRIDQVVAQNERIVGREQPPNAVYR